MRLHLFFIPIFTLGFVSCKSQLTAINVENKTSDKNESSEGGPATNDKEESGETNPAENPTDSNEESPVTEEKDKKAKVPPLPPSVLTAQASDGEFNLSWDIPVEGSDLSFLLVRKEDSEVTFTPNLAASYTQGDDLGGSQLLVFLGKELSFKDATVSYGVVYHYSLFVFDENRNYSEAKKASVNLVDHLPPSAPLNLNDGVRNNSLTETPTFSWEASTDAESGLSHYELALGTTQGSTDLMDFTDIGQTTNHQVTIALPNAETIYPSIRAVDLEGNTSPVTEGDGYQNLDCSSSAIGESGFIKVHGNTTPGLGGPHYALGSQTLLDWSTPNAGNSWTPDATTRKISDFCVMRYEAKLRHDDAPGDNIVVSPGVDIPGSYDFETDFGGASESKYKAVSVPGGRPWVTIKTGLDGTTGAAQACSNLGPGFQLINNAQWQTIARDIEAEPNNWSDSGTPGDPDDDLLNRGFSDKGYTGATDPVAADSDNGNGCLGLDVASTHDGSDPADDCGGGWHLNKRTHDLSSNEVIWDLAGNVWEWTLDLNHRDRGHGASGVLATGFISQDTYVGDSASDKASHKLAWGASGDHSGKANGGLGYFYDDTSPGGSANTPSSPGAVLRGGVWNGGTRAGAFGAFLSNVPTSAGIVVGFRCAWVGAP